VHATSAAQFVPREVIGVYYSRMFAERVISLLVLPHCFISEEHTFSAGNYETLEFRAQQCHLLTEPEVSRLFNLQGAPTPMLATRRHI
jgi:hypothetical protein